MLAPDLIPHTAHGFDPRRRCVVHDLLAQAADVDVHEIGFRIEVILPHVLQQLCACDDAPGCAQQVGEQIDLHAAAEKAELELERLMTSTNAEEKAVLAAADALSQTRGDLFKLELATELKRRQILGDDLLRKLHNMCPVPERQNNRMTDDRWPPAAQAMAE